MLRALAFRWEMKTTQATVWVFRVGNSCRRLENGMNLQDGSSENPKHIRRVEFAKKSGVSE